MNARAGTQIESGAEGPARGAARQMMAIEADEHDLIVGNSSVPGMRKFGPGVIGKDEAIADGKQRRTSAGQTRVIDGE